MLAAFLLGLHLRGPCHFGLAFVAVEGLPVPRLLSLCRALVWGLGCKRICCECLWRLKRVSLAAHSLLRLRLRMHRPARNRAQVREESLLAWC